MEQVPDTTPMSKRDLVDNALRLARLGLWEYDIATAEFTFNDVFYALFHTTAADQGGYTMSSVEYAKRFVHPDDAAMVGAEVQRLLSTTDPKFTSQVEHRIVYADGQIGYISVRFFVVMDRRGKVTGSFGINQDITQRVEHERQLQEIQNNLKEKVEELERFKKVVVDRELKMIELKEKIKTLEEKITRLNG